MSGPTLVFGEESTRVMYRIQQFAKLAGVTVRTLHPYARIGLLTRISHDAVAV